MLFKALRESNNIVSYLTVDSEIDYYFVEVKVAFNAHLRAILMTS